MLRLLAKAEVGSDEAAMNKKKHCKPGKTNSNATHTHSSLRSLSSGLEKI